MGWLSWIENNLEWIIFFGVFFLLMGITLILSNPRAKAQVWVSSLITISIMAVFFIIPPYNYIILIIMLFLIAFLLNGKWMTSLIKDVPESLYVDSNSNPWTEYRIPPESKKAQKSKSEEIQ